MHANGGTACWIQDIAFSYDNGIIWLVDRTCSLYLFDFNYKIHRLTFPSLSKVQPSHITKEGY
jgi:hypothetical protein